MQLAQLNIARMVAPLDSPPLASFVDQLEEVNAQAERADGFVWRLKDEGAGATSIRIFDDEMLLVNMSVWESAQQLTKFVYRNSNHREALRNRHTWFESTNTPMVVCWWVEDGHRPTVSEAERALLLLRTHGSTKRAFNFRDALKFEFQAPANK